MGESPYTTLDPQLREIRLLEIAPDSYEADLVISLRTARISRKRPKFIALSYAWGKGKCSRAVVLNGWSFTVGQNLDDALRQLRRSMSGHLFWIDALCINQNDIVERGRQVRLMGSIFSRAEQVVVWLGPKPKDGDYAVESIISKHMPESQDEIVMLRRALKRIYSRPWFSRLWVAQEVALAQRDPLIQIGNRSVQWHDFFEHLDLVSEETKRRIHGRLESRHSSHQFRVLASTISEMGAFRDREMSSFVARLYSAAELQATDPRDKVYGLLGVSTFMDPQKAILPDYSKSVGQVFIEAAFCMIVGSESPYTMFPLHPPSKLSLKPSAAPIHLPTWAFDLTIESRTPPGSLGWNRPSMFFPVELGDGDGEATIEPLPLHSRLSLDSRRLHTVGLHMGTVAATSGDLFYCSHYGLQQWDLMATALYDFFNGHLRPRQISPEAFLAAFNLKPHVISNDPSLIGNLIGNRLNFDEVDEAEIDFRERCVKEMIGMFVRTERTVFVTEEGHMGSVYHPDPLTGVRPGDVVAGLFEKNFPFVLRPQSSQNKVEQLYSMVNVAYVVDHQYGYDFVRHVKPGLELEDLKSFGLREYTII